MNRTCAKQKRSRRLWWMAAFALATVIAAACGSPDPEFAPPDINVPEGGSGADGENNSEAGPGADGGTDAPPTVFFDAPGDDVEAAVRQDAAKIEAGSNCVGSNPCDCDNDGYVAKAGSCAGTDCDDLDGLIRPNQTFVIEPPAAPNEGDWDCSGTIEKQYQTNLVCSGLLGCPPAQGFPGNPGCGVETDYIECRPGLLGLGCSATVIGKRRQGCK